MGVDAPEGPRPDGFMTKRVTRISQLANAVAMQAQVSPLYSRGALRTGAVCRPPRVTGRPARSFAQLSANRIRWRRTVYFAGSCTNLSRFSCEAKK